MKTISLVLRHRDDNSKIAELSWLNGGARIVTAEEMIRPELEQFIQDGLSEWVGSPPDLRPRITPSSDSRFLERLADFFRRQFSFVIELEQSDPQRKR